MSVRPHLTDLKLMKTVNGLMTQGKYSMLQERGSQQVIPELPEEVPILLPIHQKIPNQGEKNHQGRDEAMVEAVRVDHQEEQGSQAIQMKSRRHLKTRKRVSQARSQRHLKNRKRVSQARSRRHLKNRKRVSQARAKSLKHLKNRKRVSQTRAKSQRHLKIRKRISQARARMLLQTVNGMEQLHGADISFKEVQISLR